MNDELDNENFMDSNIVPITRDLINDLRIQGRHYDANRLIKIHQKNIQSEKNVYRRELERNAKKVERFIKVKNKVCVYCSRPNKSDSIRCNFCNKVKSIRSKVATFIEKENNTFVPIKFSFKIDYKLWDKEIKRYNKEGAKE